MRAIALCLLLAGCPQVERDTVLVCTVDGAEVYRSQPAPWWKVSHGVWWTPNQTQQYRQSARESCRTEQE